MYNYRLRIILSLLYTVFLISLCVGQETDCANGQDDDNDGFIDCADPDCLSTDDCLDAFTCDNTLYQVISSSLKKLDPLTGEYELVGDASSSYNGAGYNVQDGYIYGIKSVSNGAHLWRINSRGTETDLGSVSNFTGRTFVGDFDENGNLYTYTSGINPSLGHIDVSESNLQSIQQGLTNLSQTSAPGVADITYNPVFKKFYGLSGEHELLELDPVALTSRIVGDYSIDIDVTGAFGAGWSDKEGSSYFSNNNTGKIYRFSFDNTGEVTKATFVATGEKTNSNDGMGCFYSLPPFETDCTDGIDNDGDGLTDCDDPDCANAGICPAVDINLRSIDIAGPWSIIPFHLQLINRSNADAINFAVTHELPSGFSFVADSIEISTNASFQNILRPIEGDITSLTWDGLNIPIGDSITISFSVLVDINIDNGTYDFRSSCDRVIQSPYNLQHQIEIKHEVYTSPPAYDCEPAFYQVYKKRGEPNILGKLNPTTAMYQEIAVIDPQANGLGYDIESGFAYGSDGNKFIRIDEQGNITYLGIDFDKKVFVGDVDTTGYWYGKVGSDIVRVNIKDNVIDATYTDQGMPGWDMAYNKDGHFYAVHGSELYQFNTSSNTKSLIGALIGDQVPDSGHGAQWTGLDGHHYISNNRTGNIYRINTKTREAIHCMTAESNLQFNDGFACPTELPVVFNYDYGDFALMPMARHLVYEQDLGEDDIPDYTMVWLGDGVSHELFDPSNSSASGDSRDDGLIMHIDVDRDEHNGILTLNTNRENTTAYWGLWIDWDYSGTFEDFYSGHNLIDDATQIDINIDVPSDYANGKYAVRVRTSTSPISANNFGGDINEPGEVEDYLYAEKSSEICNNGLDDDKDGLIDCDDPKCKDQCSYGKTGSGSDGGLESNDILIDKITQTLFERKIEDKNDKKKSQVKFERSQKNNASTLDLQSLIPVDIIPGTSTIISSPQHLIDITNAINLLSVDVYEDNNRVAAILSLETENKVYEHTKYICDRLTGSKIVDILTYKIDGIREFIITKLQLPDGNIEYACSFGIRNTNDGTVVIESHWNLDDYTSSPSYYNFQVWANSTQNLFLLTNEIFRLTSMIAPITGHNIGKAPAVYINSGKINNNQLELEVTNTLGINYLNVAGNYRMTETTEVEDYQEIIQLSGAIHETVTIDINDPYYMGLGFYHPDSPIEDIIFLANGAWGYSTEGDQENISDYNVTETNQNEEDQYNVQRSISVVGEVKDYISFYRSFNPRFNPIDLDDYNSLTFTAKGNATLEIAILKERIDTWINQAKKVITLTPEQREYVLGKAFFEDNVGNTTTWEDANMIVINVLGDQQKSMPFDFEIGELSFSHQKGGSSYLMYTDKNLISLHNDAIHGSTIDGTNMGVIDINMNYSGIPLPFIIDNIGSSPIVVDDIELIDANGAFRISGFEPNEILPTEKMNLKLIYNPKSYPKVHAATVKVFIQTLSGYELSTFQISAQGSCIEAVHIATKDITNKVNIKAKKSITSDAIIGSNQNIDITAGQEIILLPNFEIKPASTLNIKAEDQCILK